MESERLTDIEDAIVRLQAEFDALASLWLSATLEAQRNISLLSFHSRLLLSVSQKREALAEEHDHVALHDAAEMARQQVQAASKDHPQASRALQLLSRALEAVVTSIPLPSAGD